MSAIGYVHPKSWNPVTGCSPISEGCKHCWAARMAKRQAGRNGYDANDPFEITLHEDKLDLPLCWKKPRRIACCFMGDLFHSHVRPIEQERVFQIIHAAEWHTFLLLTKRPDQALRFLTQHPEYTNLPNVWMGVSVELQEYVGRIDTLLQIPAAVRWVSLEPLLGPVEAGRIELTRVDWIVAGAETGPGARPAELDWFRAIRDACVAPRVPLWLKSLGPGDMLDGVTHKELPK